MARQPLSPLPGQHRAVHYRTGSEDETEPRALDRGTYTTRHTITVSPSKLAQMANAMSFIQSMAEKELRGDSVHQNPRSIHWDGTHSWPR